VKEGAIGVTSALDPIWTRQGARALGIDRKGSPSRSGKALASLSSTRLQDRMRASGSLAAITLLRRAVRVSRHSTLSHCRETGTPSRRVLPPHIFKNSVVRVELEQRMAIAFKRMVRGCKPLVSRRYVFPGGSGSLT